MDITLTQTWHHTRGCYGRSEFSLARGITKRDGEGHTNLIVKYNGRLLRHPKVVKTQLHHSHKCELLRYNNSNSSALNILMQILHVVWKKRHAQLSGYEVNLLSSTDVPTLLPSKYTLAVPVLVTTSTCTDTTIWCQPRDWDTCLITNSNIA